MQKVIVILGQTATGKSALAVKLAKKINGGIVSADSRQVYKNLDIGTGKINQKEMQGVPHHLLDVANPKDKFTVTEYQKQAISAIAEIVKKNKIPILVGGTGFYIDAVTKGIIFPEVPPNNKLRKILEKKTLIELFKILEKLDKTRAINIDKNNKVRLVRAIEIAKTLGKVPSLITKKSKYKFIKIGLYLPNDKLEKKVNLRVKKMFQDGLLREIKKLKKPARLGGAGVSNKRLQELGFEYWNPTEKKVVTETIKYAKRQMTWFKRDKEINWFDASGNIKQDILNYLQKVI